MLQDNTTHTPKWKRRLWTMIDNPEGLRFTQSNKRYEVVAAGRRSGKTERAKRKFIRRVLMGSNFLNPRYIAAAPTQKQAANIFWNDFIAMIPPQLLAKKPNLSNREIYLVNGATIVVAGLDQPARVEGAPSDGFLFDETDDIKRSAWEEHIDPMFIDRGAWAMYTGVPNGLAYLYDISKNALKFPDEWDFFTWKSAEVMNPNEIKKFKDRMDPRSFAQEFEASFENFTGRVYYAFERENYRHELYYNPINPLIFCFDFNSSPGIAVICQEQELPGQFEEVLCNGIWLKQPVVGTGVIGEVWIPQNSNTLIVCRKLYEDWKHHKGEIICYGDASGGQKKSSGVDGSDWDLVKDFFKATVFANRISYKYPRGNPPVKKRINSMNSRFCSVTGVRRLMVDAISAPKLVEDLEQLPILAGSAGEIDCKKNPMIGHESDALGYYVTEEFPVDSSNAVDVYDL
jgi:hypothetical protein